MIRLNEGKGQRSVEESIAELLLLDDKEIITDRMMELHGQAILQLVYTYVKNKQAVGWIEDGSKTQYIRLADVSHQIEEIKLLDEGVLIKSKILATPKGMLLKKMCDLKIPIDFYIAIIDNEIISINIVHHNPNPEVNISI